MFDNTAARSFLDVFRKGRRYLKYGLFTFLKYVEYALTAYVTFSVARMVSPAEYGAATPAFLTITYSLFGSLGINQVLLKWHSINNSPRIRVFLIQYNLLYNVLSSVVIALVAFYVLKGLEYRNYVVLICVLKLMQESTVNINRVKNCMFIINAIYLTFSISFITLYSLIVQDIDSFFKAWLVSLIVSVLLGLGSIIHNNNIFKHARYFSYYIRQKFKPLILDGLKLAVVAFITPWFLTIDRVFLINFTDMDKSLVGTLQLSDNISSLATISFSSLIFIFTHQIIGKLHSGEWTVLSFYKKGYLILTFILVAVIVGFIPMRFVILHVFPQYSDIIYPLGFFLLSKTIFIATVVPNLICLAFSKEMLYIRISAVCLGILSFLYGISILVFKGDTLFYVYPAVLLTMTVVLSVIYFFKVRGLKLGQN